MQRRTFIKYNALAALSITPLFADMGHNMHDMDSMSGHYHGTHDSSTHASHNAPIDTSFITLENENLPLPPLPQSTQELHITMSEDHSKMHTLIKQSKEQIRQNLVAMFLLNGKVFGMNDVDLRVRQGVVHDIVVTNK